MRNNFLPTSRLPLLLSAAMVCATLLLYMLLPLRDMYFYLSFPNTHFESLLLTPVRLLFSNKAIITPKHYPYLMPTNHSLLWSETGLLFLAFALLFLVYIVALRLLPQYATRRYILCSTMVLGLLFVLFPAMTSQDVFSYIAYARMLVIYHLNPLVALPTAIANDPVYPYIFWTHQPSIYGPTWVIITSVLQWGALALGLKSVLAITLALRLYGLAIHLASVQLVWLLTGALQSLTGKGSQRTRLFATLAFAWNPFLLFEGCTSAHNDTTLLFLVLLALWFLLPQGRKPVRSYVLTIVLLGLATCLKLNIIVLFPIVLLYFWKRREHTIQGLQRVVLSLAGYLGVLVLLYAPFWQHGAALYVIRVNPGTLRDVNSPYELLTHLYESFRHRSFVILSPDLGTRIEKVTHTGSFVLFSILYAFFWIRILFARKQLTTLPSLIRALALAWLAYCFIGSPWLWPWYFTTFFGLFALSEAIETSEHTFFMRLRLSYAVRLLAFALLSLYCFDTWAPTVIYTPRLYLMHLTYLRGLWICIIPLLAMLVPLRTFLKQLIWSVQERDIVTLLVRKRA